ncbi:MAG: hypothetical protein LBD18_03950 [Treponema sp.]|jgi:hypothetical protein|nr:hypothetical protein [Treponema sp.]
MSILSCNKSKEFAKELTLEEETEALKNLIEYFDLLEHSKDYVFFKVRMANGLSIGKVNSVDKEYSENAMDKLYLGIDEELDYDLIVFNVNDNTYRIIIRDKYWTCLITA